MSVTYDARRQINISLCDKYYRRVALPVRCVHLTNQPLPIGRSCRHAGDCIKILR